jgi:hypothetical protein
MRIFHYAWKYGEKIIKTTQVAEFEKVQWTMCELR